MNFSTIKLFGALSLMAAVALTALPGLNAACEFVRDANNQ